MPLLSWKLKKSPFEGFVGAHRTFVIHKRLDYGSSGYLVPAMLHVPRSAKRKHLARKKIEVNPLSVFDLLATVVGKLFDAKNSSPLPDHTAEKDNSKQEMMDKWKSSEVEVFDRRSCNRVTLAPEASVHRLGNYSMRDHPQTSNTVSGYSFIFIKSDKQDKDAFVANSMVTDTRVELGHCLGMIHEKCNRDVRSPESMESCKNKLEEIIKTPLRAEGQFSGIKTGVDSALGLYASEQAMDVDTKPPTLVSSDNSVDIALCANHTGNISIPMCEERMEHDDEENSSGCTHPKTTTSKTIKSKCVGGRRVRKLL